MKAEFPAANELEEEVKRQGNEWKTLSFTKKSKMTDFLSKVVQKKKSKVTNNTATIPWTNETLGTYHKVTARILHQERLRQESARQI